MESYLISSRFQTGVCPSLLKPTRDLSLKRSYFAPLSFKPILKSSFLQVSSKLSLLRPVCAKENEVDGSEYSDSEIAGEKGDAKWEHEIPRGAILLGTEMTNANSYLPNTAGVGSFSAILILSERDGLLLNRKLGPSISSPLFGEVAIHCGGSMPGTRYLIWGENNSETLPSQWEVMPGVFHCREEASCLIKKEEVENVYYFLGHIEWEWQKLSNEIMSGYWKVAGCSSKVLRDAMQLVKVVDWHDVKPMQDDNAGKGLWEALMKYVS